ncbi:MAG: hypothetical protein AAF385_01460 [Pseudomonadota bacterium]
MLFRRISKHLADQNWVAVGIDFAIVVVGVFIGLQVANWNEARQDANDELATVSRLLGDFETHEKVLMERSARAEQLALTSARLLAIVQSGQEPADRDSVKELIFSCLGTSFRVSPPSSYTELLESGALSKLRSQSLREALVRFGQSKALWDYLDGEVWAQKSENSKFRQAMDVRISAEAFALGDYSLQTSMIKDYNWELLQLAETSIATIVEHHWKQQNLHRRNLTATRAVLARLRAE